VKRFRSLLPLLYGHADALESADVAAKGDSLSIRLEDAETEADALLTEPEDADDREDQHDAFQSAPADVVAAIIR
jgi:hypothetical protein